MLNVAIVQDYRSFCLKSSDGALRGVPARRGSGSRFGGGSEGKAFPLFVVFAYGFEVLVNVDHVAFDEHLVCLADNAVYTDFLFADDCEEHRERFFGECLAEETVKAHVCKIAIDSTCNHF